MAFIKLYFMPVNVFTGALGATFQCAPLTLTSEDTPGLDCTTVGTLAVYTAGISKKKTCSRSFLCVEKDRPKGPHLAGLGMSGDFSVYILCSLVFLAPPPPLIMPLMFRKYWTSGFKFPNQASCLRKEVLTQSKVFLSTDCCNLLP